MHIPRRIHQIWIQGAAALPRRYRAQTSTWRKRNEGWAHTVWDERSLLALMSQRAPEWRELYERQAEVEAKSDIGRYALLETLGGLYADIDTECRRAVAPLLEGGRCRFLATCYSDHRPPIDSVTNSVLASTPRHPLWRLVLAGVHAAGGATLTIFRTGPEMLRPIFRAYAAAHPEDFGVIGFPEALTTAFLPRLSMRITSRLRRENCILDFNDSARRAVRRETVSFFGRIAGKIVRLPR